VGQASGARLGRERVWEGLALPAPPASPGHPWVEGRQAVLAVSTLHSGVPCSAPTSARPWGVSGDQRPWLKSKQSNLRH
jgi:hypothetical protein